MSKLRLGFSQLAASQIEQISELMSSRLHDQNERMNDMVWSSKCLLEEGFQIDACESPLNSLQRKNRVNVRRDSAKELRFSIYLKTFIRKRSNRKC